MTAYHLAAIIPKQGGPLEIVHRPTPTPGPEELLIEVHSIACNPIDHYMRDDGFVIASYPAIPGSDISGIVVAAGSSVPAAAPKIGTRVTALAPAFFMQGDPDHGAFQRKVLVPASSICPLTDGISFNEGAILPMAVQTAMAAWYSVGRDLECGAEVAVLEEQEYNKPRTWENIIKSSKEDGIAINLAYDAAGALQSILDILKATKGDDVAKLASAIPLRPQTPTVEGMVIKFVSAPADAVERNEWSQWLYWTWLKEKFQTGEFVPSPSIKVVDGGLKSANKALDELKGGVSGVTLVLEV